MVHKARAVKTALLHRLPAVLVVITPVAQRVVGDLLPQLTKLLNGLECYLTAAMTEEEKELLESLLTRMLSKAADWMENH